LTKKFMPSIGEKPPLRQDLVERITDGTMLTFGVSMFLYHMIATQWVFQSAQEHLITHLGFSLVLVFLGAAKRYSSHGLLSVLWIALSALSLSVTLYYKFNFERLGKVGAYGGMQDIVVGIVLLLLVFESTRLAWGKIIWGLTIAGILYLFLGYHIPGYLKAPHISPMQNISSLTIAQDSGIWCQLSVSANYIFLFMVLGALIGGLGGQDFFINIGRAVATKITGGAAQIAVVSSGLFGMVNGAAMSNVAVTGMFTIPMMKRQGFKPDFAGAVEAAASTGGQLMPPVMGAQAFMMAMFLGVPYLDIVKASAIPAFLYYWGMVIVIRATSKNLGMGITKEPVNVNQMLRGCPLFVAPLGILVYLLVEKYSPMYGCFYAILAALAISLFSKETRPSWRQLANIVTEGALSGAAIAVVVALLGALTMAIINTGFGPKLTTLMEILAHGNIPFGLVLGALLTLFFGCGLPTIPVYMIGVAVIVPMIIRLGISPFSAHLFVSYFAVVSAVTPPTATAALVASRLAGGHYIRTGIYATKMCIGILTLPFLFTFNDVLLAKAAPPLTIALTLSSSLLGIFALVSCVEGFALRKIGPLQRVLWGMAAMALFAYIVTLQHHYIYFGFSLSLVLALINILPKRRVYV
jgi:TRAP transporter 4TM/12TM fusion protein